MRTHVDWLSFTVRPNYGVVAEGDYVGALWAGITDLLGADLALAIMPGEPQPRERSRAPYSDAWDWKDQAITLFANPSLAHMTMEISGQGCEIIHKENLMQTVLKQVADQVTRIDIACDIETVTSPENFVSIMKHDRMRASGYQKSDSGTTCYIGSQKSERYARVYRYNPPHPRSHLLRIEHVFRRAYSKIVTHKIVDDGLPSVTQAAGNVFGWGHSDWNCEKTPSADISIISPAREAGKTIYWLVNSVAPAFKRLVDEGAIRDPETFIKTYFTQDK